ncbi:citrate transporter [Maledivibacter halophilus]|uniref:H+/gluconate symporter and related permeases n=1 Tax=Maledivibacter halophilus TaxID=36842 RepID=A0A1T5M600_9FIRM|nr:citrate transporter [Maledivibacter halophilus]SKC83646.1 H+/gluconate symporter and related permeases [Maledivibacter halophilus]
MIFDLPAIIGFLPLLVYIILSFRGKDMLMVVFLCVIIGAILTGQTPVTFGVALQKALGSFLGLIGFIILMGAGLGEVLSETKVAQNIVNIVVTKTGVKTRKQAMIATMAASVILVGLLGSMAGSNAILAPIIIPIVASFGISPNTLGVLLHGAGATGLFLGPFVPPVVTTMALTGISYGTYMLHVGLPVSILIWISTFIIALRTQKRYENVVTYSKEDMVDTTEFVLTPRIKKATTGFALAMIALIVYGIIAKAGAAYALVVMTAVAFVTGWSAGLSATETLKVLLRGSARMYWLFFLFVLYDPFLRFVTESGAFDALAGYLKPLIDAGGEAGFMIISTLVGVFGVSGAAVAQEKVLYDLFLPIVNDLDIPMHLWALVLLVGSQITFFAYPTGDMVGQMGLARSKDLKSMIKNGLLITALTVLLVVIRAVTYKF